jgi:hypothetical protein
MIKSCPKCQINCDKTKFEPFNPSETPDGPWRLVSIDFYGKLKCWKYLMVLVCEYSRYPLVKVISSTSCAVVIPLLNDIFATFGIPETVKTDNGPPFNSHLFKEFADELGFEHRRITPLWPRGNGMCERFMRNLGKVMRSATPIQKDWENTLVEFLRNYRATPHSSTGVAPYQLMFQADRCTTKLPFSNLAQASSARASLHQKARQRDSKSRIKSAEYNNSKLKTSKSSLQVGDRVLLKTQRSNKSDPFYDPVPYTIIRIKGWMVIIERGGIMLRRNSSFVKKYHDQSVTHREGKSRDVIKEFVFEEDERRRSDTSDMRQDEGPIKKEELAQDNVSTTKEQNETESNREEVDVGESSQSEASDGPSDRPRAEEIRDERPKRDRRRPDFYGNPVSSCK